MIASGRGHVDVVNAFLKHGASVHFQNKVKMYIVILHVDFPLKYFTH